MDCRYAEVILSAGFGDGTLTYAVPEGTEPGARVRVTLRRKELVGVVRSVHDRCPKYRVLPVLEVIDKVPLILPQQLETMNFAAGYYADSVGNILKAVLPSRIRAEAFSGYKVRACSFVAPSLEEELNRREKKKGQYKALMAFAQSQKNTLTLSELRGYGAGDAALNKLCGEGVLEKCDVPAETSCRAGRAYDGPVSELAVRIAAERKPVVVFGAGRGECAEAVKGLSRDGKVLVMMPAPDGEFMDALDPETTVRYFRSDTVASRTRAYMRILQSPESADIIVGDRISVFLPLKDIRHVVVLDEHDERYRGRLSPHFNGRDMAMWMSDRMKVHAVLFSPCPSLETARCVKDGSYALVDADVRFAAKVLEKGRDLLSVYARRRMAAVLSEGRNVLVFQNRRGYAGHVECGCCGHMPGCPNCSVMLSFHASERTLKCHYCGYTVPYDGKCAECGQEISVVTGYGTERLASTLGALFPEYSVSVLDSDSGEKYDPQARITVGTSYMTRHDGCLRNIGLVLAANADNLLTNSDFRAEEKAFRTVMTLRTLAREHGAEFIVQTRDFRQPVFKCLEDSDFGAFYDWQLAQRREMDFPPYCRMIRLELRHQDGEYLRFCAESLHALLTRDVQGCSISPVFEPDVERVDSQYIEMIAVRLPRTRSGMECKRRIIDTVERNRDGILKKTKVSVEVDPQ